MKRHAAWPVLCCLAVSATTAPLPQVEADEVIRYYWNKAQLAFESCDPVAADLSYTITATSHYLQIGKSGKTAKVDSATIKYYIRGKKVDSTQVLGGDGDRFTDFSLTYPGIFDSNYHCFGFPNDTGGTGLAIGFDADSASGDPDGLLIIDRYSCLPLELYLYFPKKSGYHTFSRALRFIVVDGYIFPDSIWEVGSREGILSNEDYRLESGISSITVLR